MLPTLPAARFSFAMHKRRGFSLMELLLVMAILVLVGALTVPSIQQTFSRQSLTKSADRVRAAMGTARVRAIREGEIYALFIVEGGSWFNIAPFSQAKQQARFAANRQVLANDRRQSNFEDDLLPKGITFAAGVVPTDARAAETLSVFGDSGAIRPILFYPDGTSQDAKLAMRNEKGNFVEIQLRGLTGLSTVVRLKKDPSLQ
jgi:type II secretion system protein H